MPRIQQLDALVVNKIAAGEVIERPASIVKELLENSLDALATRIEVDVADGGAELIRIVDDGEGIHPDDLRLSVTSHATSKIASDADLFRVRTMGFRGEALASIAAVSRTRIRSRQIEASAGSQIEVEFGRVGEAQPCGSPPGTSIEVRQLFANTPVRRKFLKATSTEFGHISEQFTRIALAHPRLHVVLRHNGRVVYELPATTQLIDRLRLLHGSELADQLIWVESESEAVRLWGYVGHPSQSKATRKGQYLFLNGRWIQDRSLQHALNEAYRGLMMVGRHPVSFLFLEVAPEQVDVNVHPTKSEVRFRDGQQLYRQLLSTLRTKFLSENLDSSMKMPAGARQAEPVDPAEQHQLQRELASWAKDQLSGWTADESIPPLPSFDAETSAPTPPAQSEVPAPHFVGQGADAETTGISPSEAAGDRSEAAANAFGSALAEAAAASVSGRPGGSPRVMQILDTYLVAETDAGLTVIDQHALHERVMYEQLRARVLSGSVESQRLLVPVTVELGPGEIELLLEHREALEQLGIGLDEFGKNTVLVTGYPPMLSRVDLSALIGDLAEQLAGAGQQPTRRDILDSLLHMMSCKAAIKAGHRLSQEEMENLLAQRHLIENAHHCPHGRPTALVLSRAELDRQFGRLG